MFEFTLKVGHFVCVYLVFLLNEMKNLEITIYPFY